MAKQQYGLGHTRLTVPGRPDLTNKTAVVMVGDKTLEEALEEGGGGVSDYSDLTNKPSINGVELSGNKTSSDLGVATSQQGAKADTAYQKPLSGIPESDLSSDVQQSLQKHFKGWYNTLAELKAEHTAIEGDSAYVKDASPATTWSIYVYDATATTDNYWADSGTDADTSNVQTFASSEEVNETYIDDTHLVNPKDGALAKAKDVTSICANLFPLDSYELKYDSSYSKKVNGFIACRNTSTRTEKHYYTSGTSINTVFIPLDNAKSVRFAFSTMANDNPQGYCFLKIENIDTFISSLSNDMELSDVIVVPAENIGNVSFIEVDREIPIGIPNGYNYIALFFNTSLTTAFAVNSSNFYCYTRLGIGVKEFVDNAVDSPTNKRNINIIQDIQKLEAYPAAVGSKTGNWTTSAKCRMLKLNKFDRRMYLKANASNNSYFSFLRDSTIVVGSRANFATGYYSNVNVVNNTDVYVDIPLDAEYLYIQDTFNDTRTPQSVIVSQYPLFGKKMAFLGDSITYGYGLDDLDKRYSTLFCKMSGCTEVNLGNSGTCLCTATKNGRENERFITRVTQQTIGDCDIVLIWGGTNDFSYDSKAIGELFVEETISSNDYIGTKKRVAPTDTDTFAGALHELLSTVRTINPSAKVVYLTIMNRGKWNTGAYSNKRPSSFEQNANGDWITDFNTAIRIICEFYAVPVIDINMLINQNWAYDDSTVSPEILSSMDDDGIHPNELGHKRIAEIIYNYMINNKLL
jgi:lysophospholipase L1-like esterase